MSDQNNVTALPATRSARTRATTKPDVPLSLTVAADAGDERQLLVAMRDRLAREIDRGVAARDLAPLTRRLMEVAAELRKFEALDAGVARRATVLRDAPFDPNAV